MVHVCGTVRGRSLLFSIKHSHVWYQQEVKRQLLPSNEFVFPLFMGTISPSAQTLKWKKSFDMFADFGKGFGRACFQGTIVILVLFILNNLKEC